MINFFYIGHFQHDAEGISLRKDPATGVLWPIASRPVDAGIVRQVLSEITGDPDSSIPDTWYVWIENGYLVCDVHTHATDAIKLVAEIAASAKCEIWHDLFQRIGIDQLVYIWFDNGQPEEYWRINDD